MQDESVKTVANYGSISMVHFETILWNFYHRPYGRMAYLGIVRPNLEPPLTPRYHYTVMFHQLGSHNLAPQCAAGRIVPISYTQDGCCFSGLLCVYCKQTGINH